MLEAQVKGHQGDVSSQVQEVGSRGLVSSPDTLQENSERGENLQIKRV